MKDPQNNGCSMLPSHIALIGCGFTGTSAFFQLVDRFPVQKITLFEASGDFGPGYAYKTEECPDYLINNTTETMCLVPANRRGFLDWLETQPDFGPDTDPNGHLPRAVFGRFLKDVFTATRTQAAIKGIEVELIPFEATNMYESLDGKVHIAWSAGETKVDAAILTTGRCPNIDNYPRPPQSSAAKYISDHVSSTDFDEVSLDASIHVLGASLSAYDVINRMFSPDTGCAFERETDGTLAFKPGPNNRKLALISRSGRMKHMQSQNPSEIRRRHFVSDLLQNTAGQGKVSLAQVVNAIQQEAKAHGHDIDWNAIANPYGDCKSKEEFEARTLTLLGNSLDAAKGDTNFLVDLFQDAQVELWDAFADQLLDLQSELAYRNTFETAMLSYVAPCPVPTAEKILALLRAGRVSIIKGVSKVRLDENGTFYEIIHQFGTERADVLVNTTGAVDRDVESAMQPEILKSLRKAGQLTAYERDGLVLKGAEVDLQNFRLPATGNIYLANMLLWGPGFFTSSAHLMATIVERILENLFKKT